MELPSSIKLSDQFGDLIGALAKAKLKYKTVERTRENTYTGSKYADLQDLTDATQEALASEGLAIVHLPVVGERVAGAYSILSHSSGQFMSVQLLLPSTGKASGGTDKLDAQTIGAAITYAKRYNYQGLTGVVGEEEDDGNSISDREPAGKKEAQKAPAASAPKMDKRPAPEGQSRPEKTASKVPEKAPEPPAAAPAAPPANDLSTIKTTTTPSLPADPVIVPAIAQSTPVESATSEVSGSAETSAKPTKSQFDAYTARAVALKQPLEKAGLKPSKGFQTGAKLKNYLLKTVGAKDLTDLTVAQWETFFATSEKAVAEDPASVVKSIEESTN